MAEPMYADGTPLPRCQYCGEFFTGYTGNQVCADCHEHIVEMEKTIAQQQADIAALAMFARVWSATDGPDPSLAHEVKMSLDDAWLAIEPIIERHQEG